jgi:hypothetical protein
MAKAYEVLSMLIPTGGYVIYGEDFDSIIYDEGVVPVTKEQFENGFAVFDAWKAQQNAQKTAARQAVLDRLGLTEEEAQLIIGGSN